MAPYRLAAFSTDHLDQATELSLAEHWPHRKGDWHMLLGLSEGIVALKGSEVVGTALRTDYGPTVSMMNMIIVKSSERGHGLGQKLMHELMHDDPDWELRLVATRAGRPLYEKLGFNAEVEIDQCQGIVTDPGAPTSIVRNAVEADLAGIIQLDTHYLEADRSELLRWLFENGTLAVAQTAPNSITGYAVLRPFGRGHVIGPIISSDIDQAQDLIRHLAAPLIGAFLRIDTDTELNLRPWLHTIGLKHTGGGIKMRKVARTNPQPVFGLCSQALG